MLAVIREVFPHRSNLDRDTEVAMSVPSPGGVAAPTPGALGTQRWRRLLPIVFVTYSLAYLDRSNYSLAVAGGMKDDLHITGGVSAFIGAAFFLGYFAFQVPGALYAERR